VTTLASGPATTGWPTATAKPFIVSGTLHGRPQSVAVASLAAVLEQIGQWAFEDPDATGSWALSSDYSAPVPIIGRLRAGLSGQRARSAHLFSLVPGVSQRCGLTSCCAAQLSITDLEWLSIGEGMPCEGCLCAVSAGPVAERPVPVQTSRPRALRSPWPRLSY
jgi:hypothetical protein